MHTSHAGLAPVKHGASLHSSSKDSIPSVSNLRGLSRWPISIRSRRPFGYYVSVSVAHKNIILAKPTTPSSAALYEHRD